MSSMPWLGQDPAVPPLAPEPAPAPGIEPDIVETQNFNTGAAADDQHSSGLRDTTSAPHILTVQLKRAASTT